jgi:putative intracellular protease/amidase
MRAHRGGRPVMKRLWVVAFLGLAAFLGIAVYALLNLDWSDERAPADQSGLIQSLAESASRRPNGRSPVRIAIFQAEEGDDEPLKPFVEIQETDLTSACEPVSSADIRGGVLQRFGVVIFPGGSGSRQSEALGEAGKRAVREFVRAGGGFVGICGGAFLATAGYDWSLALVNAKALTGDTDIPGVGTKSMVARGGGIVQVELTEAGKRVLGDLPQFDVSYSGGPILSPARRRDLPQYATLAEFRSEVWQYEPQRGTMIDTPAIVAARFGMGYVILSSPHPEMARRLHPLIRRAILAVGRHSPNVL